MFIKRKRYTKLVNSAWNLNIENEFRKKENLELKKANDFLKEENYKLKVEITVLKKSK